MVKDLGYYRKRHPFLFVVEELRENPETGAIQGRCRNHECPNSKEKGGWYDLLQDQLSMRAWSLEKTPWDCYSFYCSEECKQSCVLHGKTGAMLIKELELKLGNEEEFEWSGIPCTAEERTTLNNEVKNRNAVEHGKLQCVFCGNDKADELSVHHEMPQKTHPIFALDPDYCWVLCAFGKGNNCHLRIGHPGGTKCSTGSLAQAVCRPIRNDT